MPKEPRRPLGPPIIEVINHARRNCKTYIPSALLIASDSVIAWADSTNHALRIRPSLSVNPNLLTAAKTLEAINHHVRLAITRLRPLTAQITSTAAHQRQNEEDCNRISNHSPVVEGPLSVGQLILAAIVRALRPVHRNPSPRGRNLHRFFRLQQDSSRTLLKPRTLRRQPETKTESLETRPAKKHESTATIAQFDENASR